MTKRLGWIILLLSVFAFPGIAMFQEKETVMQPGSRSPVLYGERSASPSAANPRLYDPPIELTAIRQINNNTVFKDGESLEHNDWSRYYEDGLGIKLNYKWTGSGASYVHKWNVAIASDDLADLMVLPPSQFEQLAREGRLENMQPYFDTYASPALKELYASDGGKLYRAGRINQIQHGIPRPISSMGDGSPLLFVRMDWLERLAIPEPKTMQDVFKIMEAFTEKDPDDNGAADTYGLAVHKDLYGSMGLEGFFNGYHAYPGIWVDDGTGRLVYGSIQPEMKPALAKLRELYAAGRLDPEFGVKTFAKESELLVSGKLGLMFSAMGAPLYPLQDAVNADPAARWRPFPVPSIDEKPAKVNRKSHISEIFAVRKGAAHPEALIHLMNAHLDNLYGPGADWSAYSQEGQLQKYNYSFTNIEPLRKNMDVYTAVREALQTGDTTGLNQDQRNAYDQVIAYRNGDRRAFGLATVFNETGSFSVISGSYVEQDLFMNDGFTGLNTPTLAAKRSLLGTLETEMFTKIIYGAASLDEFDLFIDAWWRSGGEQISAEINDAKTSG
ncbi:extracellular solute-binding protein [Paenibacillus mesophilus]|uniref:extracellular solute-binding protein n=1 Tax=Paenibacillus mesophilus TaxID=2582849 RepID=UPI00110E2C7A|nr:extracellular solute-binding protein [Paenibacillus mesophilus]TMV52772.1 extracellular solute-binding protein [Paenibacillus mesophilus]